MIKTNMSLHILDNFEPTITHVGPDGMIEEHYVLKLSNSINIFSSASNLLKLEEVIRNAVEPLIKEEVF